MKRGRVTSNGRAAGLGGDQRGAWAGEGCFGWAGLAAMVLRVQLAPGGGQVLGGQGGQAFGAAMACGQRVALRIQRDVLGARITAQHQGGCAKLSVLGQGQRDRSQRQDGREKQGEEAAHGNRIADGALGQKWQIATGGQKKTPLGQQAGQIPNDRSLGRGLGLCDFFLDFLGVQRQFVVFRLGQIGVKPAAMINAAQASGRDAQAERAAQNIGNQGDLIEVGQKAAAIFVVGMADSVARHRAFSREFTDARHGAVPCFNTQPPHGQAAKSKPADKGKVATRQATALEKLRRCGP